LVGPDLHLNCHSARTPLMSSLVRLFIAPLLCCVLAAGHAPAWLHVLTCESTAHSVDPADEVAGAPACCSQHSHCSSERGKSERSKSETRATATNASQGSPGHQHHSDDCMVCQSLAGPLGVTWEFQQPVATSELCERVVPLTDCQVASVILSLPHLRGPPA